MRLVAIVLIALLTVLTSSALASEGADDDRRPLSGC